jgi:hypothetical protein
MPTKELEDALAASKLGNAERDLIDVIARMFEIPENLVERVLYAGEVARSGDMTAVDAAFEGESLDPKLKQGIIATVHAGMARVTVRLAIHNGRWVLCPVGKLIRDPVKICDGCPISLACIAHSLSTQDICHALGPPTSARSRTRQSATDVELERYSDGCARVTPLKIVGDTVTVSCEHPKGTYQVQAKDLRI